VKEVHLAGQTGQRFYAEQTGLGLEAEQADLRDSMNLDYYGGDSRWQDGSFEFWPIDDRLGQEYGHDSQRINFKFWLFRSM
jgi:hypothetical protein